MDFFRPCIQYISRLFRFLLRFFIFCSAAVTGCVIDAYSRLDVIAERAELHKAVFHRSCLHKNASAQKFIPFKAWGHPVHDMVARSFYILTY